MSTFNAPDGPRCPWDDPGVDGHKLRLDEYPSALIMRTANLIQAETTSIYAREHGLTVPEWRLLSRLHESAPMQLAALCKTSFFDKAYAGRILRALEEKGLVQTLVDEAHRRRHVIHLTKAGCRLAKQVEKHAQRSQSRLLELLTQEERRALYAILHKLAVHAPGVHPEKES